MSDEINYFPKQSIAAKPIEHIGTVETIRTQDVPFGETAEDHLRGVIREMKETHVREIQELEEKHDRELRAIDREHRKEVRSLKEELARYMAIAVEKAAKREGKDIAGKLIALNTKKEAVNK